MGFYNLKKEERQAPTDRLYSDIIQELSKGNNDCIIKCFSNTRFSLTAELIY